MDNKKVSLTIDLPLFKGFYNSGYMEQEIDTEILFNDVNNVNEDVQEWILNNIDNFVDYSKMTKNYAILICDYLSELEVLNTNIKFTFNAIRSPKYYNYENDSIECDIKLSTKLIKDLEKYCFNDKKDQFEYYLKENFSNRDGFISYYSDNIKDWINKKINSTGIVNIDTDINIYIQTLLDFYYSTTHGDLPFIDEYHEEVSIYDYIDYNNLVIAINKKFNLRIRKLSDLE